MRELTQRENLRQFMRELGAAAGEETRAYFIGGARPSCLAGGRRPLTSINVELASPAHSIPELPGWERRSVYIAREGRVTYYHYDFYAQTLAKIERGHAQDRTDVTRMLVDGHVDSTRLRELFEAIAPLLHRYPALDPCALRRALDAALASG